jgi:hypothetical protein
MPHKTIYITINEYTKFKTWFNTVNQLRKQEGKRKLATYQLITFFPKTNPETFLQLRNEIQKYTSQGKTEEQFLTELLKQWNKRNKT